MSKRVRISDDAGSTYYTFPGDTGDLQNTMANIKDTVFGQDYESDQPGMITWMISCDGLYKGFAGYVAKIKKSGTPTTMTAEPAAVLVSGIGGSNQITDTTKRVIDPETAVTVLDNAVDHTADVLSIDYLEGIVVWKGAYTPTLPVTITGKYLPLTQIAKGQSFTLTQTAATIDESDFITAQANGGRKVFDYGLKTVAFDTKGFYAISNGWIAALQARGLYVLEIGPDGSGKSVARGIFKLGNQQQAGKVGELETEDLKFTLFVPDPSGLASLMKYPFQWYHSATTLSTALQKALSAWESNTQVLVQYLYDGTNGQVGTCVITDASLTGGLEVMNSFALKFQGSGTLTAVGTG